MTREQSSKELCHRDHQPTTKTTSQPPRPPANHRDHQPTTKTTKTTSQPPESTKPKFHSRKSDPASTNSYPERERERERDTPALE